MQRRAEGRLSSTEAANRLKINWRRGSFPARARRATPTRCFPLSSIFENDDETKPALVWFTSLNPDEKAEKRLFDSWEVAVASRYFNCVKIYADDIESKADRERYAKVVPTLILFDGAGREVTRVVGTGTSSPNVYAAMQKAVRADLQEAAGLARRDLQRLPEALRQGPGPGLAARGGDRRRSRSHLEARLRSGRKMLKEHQEEVKPLVVERDKLLEQEKSLLEARAEVEGDRAGREVKQAA